MAQVLDSIGHTHTKEGEFIAAIVGTSKTSWEYGTTQ